MLNVIDIFCFSFLLQFALANCEKNQLKLALATFLILEKLNKQPC